MKELFVGAHTSIAGGLHNALTEGKAIGATTIQIFTANQRRWDGKSLVEEEVDAWKKAIDETEIQCVMSHASYLLNLGASNPEILEKSRKLLREELARCRRLGLSFLNFHPGAAVGGTTKECIDKIIASLLMAQGEAIAGPTLLVLETTAGQGSCIGAQFEEIAEIIEGVKGSMPIGVCVDTCHIFAAGYDIRTQQGLDETLKKFDQTIGLNYLKTFHLNDSLGLLGSRKDRHKPLGEGAIGLECFRHLMQDPRTAHVPKYLETPDGPPLWTKEIALLRSFAK